MATFVSELFDISKMQQINATVMLPNRYRQLITSQLQSTSQIVMRKFLIRGKYKGNKKGDLIQGLLFLSFIHTNKQLFPNILTGSQP